LDSVSPPSSSEESAERGRRASLRVGVGAGLLCAEAALSWASAGGLRNLQVARGGCLCVWDQIDKIR
jgi:hypothetical protein